MSIEVTVFNGLCLIFVVDYVYFRILNLVMYANYL